jgi:RNA polymerase sigma-70 factor (ECF subfamily)
VTNIAKTRGQREGRSVPFAALAGDDLDAPTFDPSMFMASDDPRWPSHWFSIPADWTGIPEDRCSRGNPPRGAETLDTLPPMQAEVLRLRDVLGWSSEEVRNALDLTETNQRVLLHRARAKVRRALERDFEREANA